MFINCCQTAVYIFYQRQTDNVIAHAAIYMKVANARNIFNKNSVQFWAASANYRLKIVCVKAVCSVYKKNATPLSKVSHFPLPNFHTRI